MPLKLVRRKGSPYWHISGTLAGTRVRESTGTAERRLAEEKRAARERDILRGEIYGREAVATWGEALRGYLESEPRKPNTLALLARIDARLGTTPLKDIDQRMVDRLCAVLCRPDAAPATKLRNIVGPLRAVLTHAARRGLCRLPAFEVPKGATGIKRTRWLTPAEVAALCAAAADHLRPLIVFLVGTGCRMSEAIELEWDRVDLEHRQARVWQKQGNERAVELPPSVVAALATLPGERSGRVFRTARGEPYADHERRYGGQIKRAWRTACRRAGLGPEVTPHVLRHTWASWSYCLTRDLIRLRDAGGWSGVDQVERYTKLVPETMEEEIKLAWGLSQGRRVVA